MTKLKLIGIRRDVDSGEFLEYELNLSKEEVQTIYKDIYGVYVGTKQGKVYKIKSTLELLEAEILYDR